MLTQCEILDMVATEAAESILNFPTVRPLCRECGGEGPLKTGWTRARYCSENCERHAVARLHAHMPGGPSPYLGWIPHHISLQIAERWETK